VPEVKISIVMASLRSKRGHLTVEKVEKEDFGAKGQVSHI